MTTPAGFAVEFPTFADDRDYWTLAAIVAEAICVANVHSDKDARTPAQRQLTWSSRGPLHVGTLALQPVRLACAIPDGSPATCLEISCLEAARLRRGGIPAAVVLKVHDDGSAHALVSSRGVCADPSASLPPQPSPSLH
jgi:hypothetical protein